MNEVLHDCFVPSTCIGMSIYRKNIFEPLKNDCVLLDQYNKLFACNYGFGWLGYFWSLFANGNYRAALINVRVKSIAGKKKQAWAVRFYGCWADDLCYIIDNIPNSYVSKSEIPKSTWKVMKLDTFTYSYLARKHGDLCKEKYVEMKNNGILGRITDHQHKIWFYATTPILFLDVADVFRRLYKRCRSMTGRRR